MTHRSSPTNRKCESLVAIADRHRSLHTHAETLEAVTHVDTVCLGARTETDTPTIRTELVLDREHSVVPPAVLAAIAECDLGVAAADPQGVGTHAQLVVTVQYR